MKRKKYNLLSSFNFAFKGIAKVSKTERNMKIHLFIGTITLLLGIILKISSTELIILILTITAVLAAEIFNTSIENICNLMKKKLKLSYYETHWIRNVSAAAVLVLCLAAITIGLIIFLPKLQK